MTWEKVKLGDIADTCLGKMLDKNKNKGEYKPYLANINVRWGNFDLSNLSKMRFLDTEEKRYGLKYGDLLICEGGEPGRCAIWKDQIPNMKFQKALHRVRAKKNVLDNRYLYYWFLLAGKRNALKQYFTGATIMHMPADKLKTVIIDLPPLPTQTKIANILSAYDDLIENNQKQIKLLEEAAQRLYKEWFVDFRFPGYESTEFVDGLPKGWAKTAVGEYLSVRSGYAFKSSWWQKYGYPVVKIKDINNNTVDISALDCVEPEKTKSIQEFKLNKGDVVIAMTGATIGKIGLVPEVDNLFTNQRVGKVFPKDNLEKPTGFIFCFYSQKTILDKILALSSSSSAQPNISGSQLESFMVYGNLEIINKFNNITYSYFEKINNLYKQIKLLTEARDRLLPKLMSGEIVI